MAIPSALRTILCWRMPPAQKVIVRQSLDSDLDLRTFRLGSFGFHNLVFNVPENRSILR